MFEIQLNMDAAAVLLRCLTYGENAISKKEQKSGEGVVIENNIRRIRRAICKEISREGIKAAAIGGQT